MGFNELNSVEYFIVQQLTGVNLNSQIVGEPIISYSGLNWEYKAPEVLKREITEVFIESELRDKLIALNPAIAASPDKADEVIHKLRAILISVGNMGLVRANEEFAKWLKGEMSMPFGKDGAHVEINLIDFNEPKNNSYWLSNQFKIRTRETKIPDIILFINGIPVVVGEAKTPVRPAVSWVDGAYEIHEVYENAVPSLFVPAIFSFATEGKTLCYGAVRTPLEFWCPWRLEDDKNELAHFANLQDVGKQMSSLLHPKTLLDILQNFTIYPTNTKKR